MKIKSEAVSKIINGMISKSKISSVIRSRMVDPARETGFCPVQVQTGAGKTRSAMEMAASYFMERAANQPMPDIRQVVYTTPRVESIRAEMTGLHKRIDEICELGKLSQQTAAELKNRTIVLPSRKDIIGDISLYLSGKRERGISRQNPGCQPAPKTGNPEQELFKAVTGKNITNEQARKIKSLREKLRDKDIGKLKEEEISQIIWNRNDIFFSGNFDEDEDMAEMIVSRSSPEGRMMFPNLFVTAQDGAKIVLMSSKRLLFPVRGYSSSDIWNPMSPHNDPAKKRIIFIDEADAAFLDFKSHVFDEMDKQEIDMVWVINHLSYISKESQHFSGDRKSEEALVNLINKAEEIRDKRDFKSVIWMSRELIEKLNGRPPTSVGDGLTWSEATISAGVSVDPISGTRIGVRERTEGEIGLNSYFHDVRHDFDRVLIPALSTLVRYNKSRMGFFTREDAVISQDDSLFDIINKLRMNPEGRRQPEHSVKNVLLSKIERYEKQTRRDQTKLLSVHDTGVIIAKTWNHSVKHGISPDTQINLYTSITRTTPNAMLVELARSHKVIGMSATINSPNITSNFDMEYIKERLPENAFRGMTPTEEEAVHNEYTRLRQIKKAEEKGLINIKRTVISKGAKEDFKQEVIEALAGMKDEHVTLSKRTISELMSTGPKGDGENEWESFTMLLKAIREFLQDEGSEKLSNLRMMAFMNKKVRWKNYSLADLPSMQSMVEKYAKHVGKKTGRTPRVELLYADDFKERGYAFRDGISYAKPLILLTTYQTAGAGFNLQCPISENREHLIDIGDGSYHSDEVDFDTFYLDKITYPIMSGHSENISSIMRDVYAIQSISLNGEISNEKMRELNKNILNTNERTYNGIMGEVNKTREYRHVVMSRIEQGVGRGARTTNRRKVIKHLVHEDLMPLLKASSRDYEEKGHSWEFYSMLKWADEQQGVNANKEFGPSDFTSRMVQRATQIQFIIKKIFSVYDPKTERELVDIKVAALKNPVSDTMNLIIHEPDERGDATMIVFSAEEDLTRFGIGHNSKLSMTRSDQHPHRHESSEAVSRLAHLMKNATVREWFEERGFATEWRPMKYVIDPMTCQALYIPEIGEQAVKALMTKHEIDFSAMPAGKFEVFDMLCGEVPVDIKNYAGGFASMTETRRDHMIDNSVRKAREHGYEKIVLLSVFGSDDEVEVISKEGVDVILLNGLLSVDGAELGENIFKLKQEVSNV